MRWNGSRQTIGGGTLHWLTEVSPKIYSWDGVVDDLTKGHKHLLPPKERPA